MNDDGIEKNSSFICCLNNHKRDACGSGETVLHEILSSLGFYGSGKYGKYAEIHGHSENEESILHGKPKKNSRLSDSDKRALSGKIKKPPLGTPSPVGAKTDQTYTSDSAEKTLDEASSSGNH